MSNADILQLVHPLTKEIARCNWKKQAWKYRRDKLISALEKRRKGFPVDWAELRLKHNIEKLLNG